MCKTTGRKASATRSMGKVEKQSLSKRNIIQKYKTVEKLDRKIVETLIDYISVGKRIPGTRDVPIEIHWNF